MAVAEIKVSITDTDEFKKITAKFLAVAECLAEYVDLDISDDWPEYDLRERSRKLLCELAGEKYTPDPHIEMCKHCHVVSNYSEVNCPNCGGCK